MHGSYEIVNPLRYPGWDDLLLSGGDRDFFHTVSWAAVLSETYGYEPVYCFNTDHGIGRGLLPAMDVRSRLTGIRGVSLPFTDYGAITQPDDQVFQEMLRVLLREGASRGWKYLELRGGEGIPAGTPVASSYLRHSLELTVSADALFKGCSENFRRNVRKAQHDGVSVAWQTGPDAIGQFYRLHCLTRKRHGAPPPPYRFFENLQKHVLSRGLGLIALASIRKTVVAGAVYLRFADRAIFKYGASDINHERHRANHLVMWEAISRFALERCRELCFGRTDIGDEGLRRFKAGWGAREQPLPYYRYDLAGRRFVADVSIRGRRGSRIMSKMPVALLRAAGSVLYRHIG